MTFKLTTFLMNFFFISPLMASTLLEKNVQQNGEVKQIIVNENDRIKFFFNDDNYDDLTHSTQIHQTLGQYLRHIVRKTTYQIIDDCLEADSYTFESQANHFPCYPLIYYRHHQPLTAYFLKEFQQKLQIWSNIFEKIRDFLTQEDAEALLTLYANDCAWNCIQERLDPPLLSDEEIDFEAL